MAFIILDDEALDLKVLVQNKDWEIQPSIAIQRDNIQHEKVDESEWKYPKCYMHQTLVFLKTMISISNDSIYILTLHVSLPPKIEGSILI